MKKLMMMVIVLVIILSIGNVQPATASSTTFTDIKGHWAESVIYKASNDGLVTGFSDGTFRPNDIVTADQFLSMMYRAYNNGRGQFLKSFTDEIWHYGYFNDLINAYQSTEFKFANSSSGYWAQPYLDMAFESNLIPAGHGLFENSRASFSRQIKREEAAYLLYLWTAAYEQEFSVEYRDYVATQITLTDMDKFTYNSITNAAKEHVLMMGLMAGYPDNKFLPQRYVTRAEAVTMIYRLKNKETRNPFMPVPKGKYYVTADNQYYIFPDKFKQTLFNEVTDLLIDNGHSDNMFYFGTNIMVFDSKDEKNNYKRLRYMGYYYEAPVAELSMRISTGNNEIVSLIYEKSKKFDTTGQLFDEYLKLLHGKSDIQVLKTKLNALEKSGATESFKIDGKSYSFDPNDLGYSLTLHYK